MAAAIISGPSYLVSVPLSTATPWYVLGPLLTHNLQPAMGFPFKLEGPGLSVTL